MLTRYSIVVLLICMMETPVVAQAKKQLLHWKISLDTADRVQAALNVTAMPEGRITASEWKRFVLSGLNDPSPLIRKRIAYKIGEKKKIPETICPGITHGIK